MPACARPLLTALLPLALWACGTGSKPVDTPSLDAELASGGNDQDPLLRAAVQDPIMTDTQLSTRSNTDAVFPPPQPWAAPVPPTDVAAGTISDDGSLMKTPDATGTCHQCAIAQDAMSGTLTHAGPSGVGGAVSRASEALYRDANSFIYADHKPNEDQIDRVVKKLNEECVLAR